MSEDPASVDNNTLQVVLAGMATVQAIVLAYIGYRQHTTEKKVDTVHTTTTQIANGLSTTKDAALVVAAAKTGELIGRDFEAAKHENGEPKA